MQRGRSRRAYGGFDKPRSMLKSAARRSRCGLLLFDTIVLLVTAGGCISEGGYRAFSHTVRMRDGAEGFTNLVDGMYWGWRVISR
jgi:hypothetical protein